MTQRTSKTASSALKIKIQPRARDIGGGFQVRRALPFREKRMVGPFVFWDHMGPSNVSQKDPLVVRAHPHIGLSTLTYLFSGEILHRDSLGNETWIRPGEVNWMTAGEGIVHSERSHPKQAALLEGIQLWVALPKEKEEISPSFHHFKTHQLPTVQWQTMELKLIAGSFQKTSPVPVQSDLFLLETTPEKDQTIELPQESTKEMALYLVSGALHVGNDLIQPGELVVFKNEPDVIATLKTKHKSHFFIFGGEPLPEKRHLWWNFVASDFEKIKAAQSKWKDQKFPSVINETEFIPLPEA